MSIHDIQIVNPFPGLRPYDREQADFFFGREEQIDELLGRIEIRRFVGVVGTSGSGKSSLIRAGLIPALQRGFIAGAGSIWRTVLMRPGREPVNELARRLGQEFGFSVEDAFAVLDRSSMGLANFAQQNLSPGQNLLLVVDQFEEIFRYFRTGQMVASTSDESAAFVKLLLSAVGRSDVHVPELAELPIYIVLTMRSDFVGKCAQFRGLPEALNDSQYLVPRMTRDQLLESIEGPTGMGGARIAPRLSQRLLNDAGENPDLLPVLQHLLMRLWNESSEARLRGEAIDLKHYENPSVGGMARALNLDANCANQEVAKNDRAQWMVQRIFQRLVEPGAKNEETRRPTTLSELAAVCDASIAEIESIIQPFRERGFLTVSADQDPVVDISHESFIRLWDRLSGWVKDEVASAAIYKRLAESAAGKLALYRDPDLTQALAWRKNTGPNFAWAERYPISTSSGTGEQAFQQAMSFLDRSQRNERWRVWRKIGAIAALGLLTIVFASMAVRLKIANRDEQNLLEDARQAHQREHDAVQQTLQSEKHRADEQQESAKMLKQKFDDEKQMVLIAQLERRHAQEEATTARNESQRADNEAARAKGEKDRADKNAADATSAAAREADARRKADDLADFANAGRFAADAFELASERLDLSLLLGMEAYRMSHNQRDFSNQLFAELTSNPNLTGFLRPGHRNAVRCVAFSPDGDTLASAGVDGNILLWNLRTRWRLGPPLMGHTDTVFSVAFGDHGRLLASGSGDGKIRIWDVKTGKSSGSPVTAPDKVYSVAFNHAGNLLASGGKDGNVTLWDVSNRPDGSVILESHATLQGHQDHVYSVAFNPADDNVLASAGADKTILLWNVAQLKQVKGSPLRGHDEEVFSVAFSRDGKKMASAGMDEKIVIWDVRARKPDRPPLSEAHSNSIFTVAFSPDGTKLASGSTDGKVLLWNLDKRQSMELTGYSERVFTLAFSPPDQATASSTLVSGDADGSIVMWDDPPQKWLGTGINESQSVTRVEFSPDRTNPMLAFATTDKKIHFRDVAKNMQLDPPIATQTERVTNLAFSPSGEMVASVGGDDAISIWDARKHELRSVIKTRAPAEIIAFHPNGRIIASNGPGGSIFLWDVMSGAALPVSPLIAGDKVVSIAFSPDGKTLASGSNDGTIVLWDVSSGTRVDPPLTGHENEIRSLVFSPDGRLLASAGLDRSISLWYTDNHQRKCQIAKHQGPVNQLAFSLDGSILASASDDKGIMLWDVQTGRKLGRLVEHHAEVKSVAFSPDGKYLVSGSSKTETHWSLVMWDMRADQWEPRACDLVSRNLSAEEWRSFVGRKSDHVTCPAGWLREIDANASSNRLQAERDFSSLVLLAVQEGSAVLNNQVCWYGSLDGFASIVAPSCEKAIALDPQEGFYQDSFALAQSLLGHYDKAIAGFESFLGSPSGNTDEMKVRKAKREAWIASLRKGQNPFDAATLRSLRAE